jgi:hypothetical protein
MGDTTKTKQNNLDFVTNLSTAAVIKVKTAIYEALFFLARAWKQQYTNTGHDTGTSGLAGAGSAQLGFMGGRY